MAGDPFPEIAPHRRAWLWAEFLALYLGAPAAIALFLNPDWLFAALFGFTLAGLALLWHTGGFDWRALIRGWEQVDWGQVALFGLLAGLLGYAVVSAWAPDHLRPLSGTRLRFLGVLWLLYPLLSALPQELIFRPLFFHRYGGLMPDARTAMLVNAAVFSFAHLMYWSLVVAALTFAGGWIFARAYLDRGFPAAWMLHAVAGNALFTVGMGAFLWSGNVVRPF
ncbi:MAG TPA: CPBP family intramembrane metalloprotease [Paracoccus sp. (in: a-proteobacteria)]|nr:CPBP family intramembrane metalloprotease [Paracoccus sp. (in: a-proteobacteria)]